MSRRDEVSVPEAMERFGISETTIRRKLREGAIAGAEKVRGRKGNEWRLPVESLRELG